MCLSTVYELKDGKERMISEYVNSVEFGEGDITFTDILGQESTVHGVLRSIDLVKNKILVEAK